MPGCHVKPEQMFNLIFGYAGQILEKTEVEGAGDHTSAYSTPVPPNELHVMTGISAKHDDVNSRTLMLRVWDGTDFYHIARREGIAKTEILDRQGMWILVEGDMIEARCLSLGAGKSVFCEINGYKMILSQ